MFLCLVLAAAAPQLSLISVSRIGQPLVFQLSGSIAPPGPADTLLIDTAAIPGGLPLGTLGTLFVGAGPALIAIPGDGTHQWTLPVPATPSLVGLNLFAQALGLAPPGGVQDLQLSNLLVVHLKDGAPAFGRFAFSADPLEGSVSSFTVDPTTGALRQRAFAALGGQPRAVAAHPSGRWVFAARAESNDIVPLEVDLAQGALTPLAPTPAGDIPLAVLAEPTGRFLYAANAGAKSVSQFAIDSASGTLTPLVPPALPLNSRVTGLALTPDGKHLYALGGDSSGAFLCQIEPSSGRLVPMGAVALPPSPTALVFAPNGAFAYSTGALGDLVAHSVDPLTGLLSAFASPALPAGAQPTGATLSPNGSHLYVADSALGQIHQFRLSSVGVPNALNPGSVACPGGATQVRVDPTGDFLFALAPADAAVRIFSIHPATGALTPAGEVRTRGSSADLAVPGYGAPIAPRTPQIYVALEGAAEVRGFALDNDTGLLTGLANAVADTAPGPVSVALHPSQPLALSANFTGQSLTRLALNEGNGAITALGSPTASSGAPFDLAFEPSGRFAFVPLFATASVQAYAVDPQSGQVTPLAAASGTPNSFPRGIAVDPTGRFAYVAESFAARVHAYRIDGPSGALSSIGTSAAGNGVFDVAVEPSGRFAYAVNNGAATIQQYTIDANTGALLPLAPATLPTGTAPFELAVTPNGRFLFTANSTSASVSRFAIDPQTGALTALGDVAVANDPRNAAIDASGRYLFVAHRAVGVLSVLRIDSVTGDLAPVQQISAGGAQPRGIAPRVVFD